MCYSSNKENIKTFLKAVIMIEKCDEVKTVENVQREYFKKYLKMCVSLLPAISSHHFNQAHWLFCKEFFFSYWLLSDETMMVMKQHMISMDIPAMSAEQNGIPTLLSRTIICTTQVDSSFISVDFD